MEYVHHAKLLKALGIPEFSEAYLNDEHIDAYPKKINFNFLMKCNMGCPYCYIPFRNRPVSQQTLIDVFNKIAILSPREITIGGSDPLLIPCLCELLSLIRDNIEFIYLDTNLINLGTHDKARLFQMVDRLGISIDGPIPDVHNQMRKSRNHFEQLNAILPNIASFPGYVKINTVVAKPNFGHINGIAKLIIDLANTINIREWSVYQFWPMERGMRHQGIYYMDEKLFIETVSHLKCLMSEYGINTKIRTMTARTKKYFFVSDAGEVYLVSPLNPTDYAVIGTIFEKHTFMRWHYLKEHFQLAA